MTFAGGASHHQHAHGQKARKFFSDKIDNRTEFSGHTFDQILADEKYRLDCANISDAVFEQQVAMLKIVGQRLLDDFVEAMILALVLKRALPRITPLQLGACD